MGWEIVCVLLEIESLQGPVLVSFSWEIASVVFAYPQGQTETVKSRSYTLGSVVKLKYSFYGSVQLFSTRASSIGTVSDEEK